MDAESASTFRVTMVRGSVARTPGVTSTRRVTITAIPLRRDAPAISPEQFARRNRSAAHLYAQLCRRRSIIRRRKLDRRKKLERLVFLADGDARAIGPTPWASDDSGTRTHGLVAGLGQAVSRYSLTAVCCADVCCSNECSNGCVRSSSFCAQVLAQFIASSNQWLSIGPRVDSVHFLPLIKGHLEKSYEGQCYRCVCPKGRICTSHATRRFDVPQSIHCVLHPRATLMRYKRMKACGRFLILLGAQSLVHPEVARADDQAKLNEIRSDYSAGVAALERAFGTIRGSGKLVIEVVGNVADQSRSCVCAFARKPGMNRFLASDFNARRGDEQRHVPDVAVCRNNSAGFRLEKKSGAAQFTITDIGSSSKTHGITEEAFWTKVDSPYWFADARISEYPADPTFALTKVDQVEVQQKKLLKLHFHYNHKPGAKKTPLSRTVGGWVLVSPAEHWIIYEYEAHFRRPSGDPYPLMTVASVEYGESHSGIPLPKKAITKEVVASATPVQLTKTKSLKTGSAMNTVTAEFTNLDFLEEPDSSFTLASFGLPEIAASVAKTPRTSSTMTIWLFLAAIVFLVVAIAAKWLGRRRKSGLV